MSSPELDTVRLQRTLPATPEEVFDAWTSPEVLARWWGPSPTWSSPGCEVDLRVGGRYRLRVTDDDGRVYAVGGEYREVDRPHRLVYTWCWEGANGPDPGHVSVVTVEFLGDPDGTTVVLEHRQLASEDSRSAHAAGWIGALDNLAKKIFVGGDSADTDGPA